MEMMAAGPANTRFQFNLRTMFVVVTVVAVLLAMLVGVIAVVDYPQSHKTARCANNLKQIGLALQNYHDAHRVFPPAYVADSHSRPIHSWRVLLLPYTGDHDAKSLYDAYDFAEPWDGPNNRRLIARMPNFYRCPADLEAPPGTTNYVAVVGDETAWPFAHSRNLGELADGVSNTCLVTEATGLNIPWTEPRDLDFGFLDFKINPTSGYGVSGKHTSRANCLMGDGSVRYMPLDTAPEIMRAVFTVRVGEVFAFP